jgi:hydrogenase maturation protease
MKTLVAGVGNIFFGDDAFGSEVAQRLLREEWPEDVSVADFGIRSMDLMFALMDGHDTVVLIDATARGGAPGTVYLIEPEEIGSHPAELVAHSMDVMKVLTAARSMGAAWNRLLVVGCEPSPDSADPDGPGALGMSEAVSAAVEEAIELIRRIVCKSTLAKSAK